ncbi:MAG: 30S ribosomal protein S8 [Parcubacteria group bacterium GW2011_GWA2_47_21]|nr:MAG: 30S ribosomal protein S8 [Parcubacteria group bacterium GW2011_GWA2_47_21]
MVNDSISALITEIKNSNRAGKEAILFPYSKLNLAVAELLLKKGFLRSVSKRGKKTGKFIELGLAYEEGRSKVSDVKRISKLSRRVYYGVSDIRPVMNGFGVLAISTTKGIMTGEEAKKNRVGGEALFEIW